jgi:glutamate N-acetyltransferase/amino-acid N-acetyltransferase
MAASGHAGHAPIVDGRSDGYAALRDAMEEVFLSLAHQVVRDGEGATKFVELRISGAATPRAARTIGLAIANSPLVKTAWAGEDPNWGRIVMAVGKSGEKADRDTMTIRYGEHPVAEKGWRSPDYDEDVLAAYMRNPEIVVSVDVGVGAGEAKVWTCDLTHGYISINADYRS